MVDEYTASRIQYAPLFRLVDLAKLYDELYWENYAKAGDIRPVYEYKTPDVKLRRTTTREELARLKSITAALDTIASNKLPSKAALTAALSPAEHQTYKVSLSIPMTQEDAVYGETKPPDDLKRYNELLRKADLLDYRYDVRGQHINGHYVESCYEDAVQYLADIFDGDVAIWLDRSFTPGDQDCTNKEQVPRVLGSKSKYAVNTLPKLSKRIKQKLRVIEALLVAAFDIAYVTQETQPSNNESQVDRDKLKLMLKT